jgi:transposase
MAITISIRSSDLSIINAKRKSEPLAKFQRRYHCLWLLNEGYLRGDIAKLLGVNIDTITDWIKLYNKEGLNGLGLLKYEGRRPSILDGVQDQIKDIVKNENIATIAELQERIKKKFQLEVEHSWLYRYCKKNSISLIKRPG